MGHDTACTVTASATGVQTPPRHTSTPDTSLRVTTQNVGSAQDTADRPMSGWLSSRRGMTWVRADQADPFQVRTPPSRSSATQKVLVGQSTSTNPPVEGATTSGVPMTSGTVRLTLTASGLAVDHASTARTA